MHLELQDGIVALGLLTVVASLLAVAPALRIPYPILLVLGGLATGLVPGMPSLELETEEWVREDTAGRMRGLYQFRTDRFRARFDDGDEGGIESRSQDYQRLRRELLDAERQAVLDLRRTGVISNDVWIRVARDLDLEDQRLDI